MQLTILVLNRDNFPLVNLIGSLVIFNFSACGFAYFSYDMTRMVLVRRTAWSS